MHTDPSANAFLRAAARVVLLVLALGSPLKSEGREPEAPAPTPSHETLPVAQTPEVSLSPSYQRTPSAFGLQLALVSPTNGGLRVAAGAPGLALGLHGNWTLLRGLRLRPRLDCTVFGAVTRTSPAAPLPQSLETKVSSLALGMDLLMPLGGPWALGLGVFEVRWSVASTNTVTPTLGGRMTLAGTSHWTRLGLGPVLSFQVHEHLDVEGRVLSSHYGHQNQPATTATLGLLWRF